MLWKLVWTERGKNMTTLNQTPSANRLHIGFFGKRNSGKSSLINAFTGQEISIVSDVLGTTTDVVSKPMEIHGLGACVLLDTAGFDDEGELGKVRVEKTEKAAEKIEIAVLVFSGKEPNKVIESKEKMGEIDSKANSELNFDIEQEMQWFKKFKSQKTPVLAVVNKVDVLTEAEQTILAERIRKELKVEPVLVSALEKKGIEELKEAIIRLVPEEFGEQTITGDLVSEEDVVLLVMPQDIQAPKGRLILPQVQTIRELLDKKCTVISTTTDKIDNALAALKNPPKLIITDSQVFKTVYEKKPEESMLTSFSVLFAGYKGDLSYYIEGANVISQLTEESRVLIAECCTHAPLEEDIGRVKIPMMLRKKIGQGLTVDMVSGTDFPKDLTEYDLIIQCGACMFNRKYVMSRIDRAKEQGVPMCNYGVTIAYLTGILDKISY